MGVVSVWTRVKFGYVSRIQRVQWATEQKPSPFHYFFKLLIKKSSRVSGPVLRRLQLVQTKLNRPLDAIASESHSSSGRFIPLPPLFIAIAHCHPLFPNLDFCSIYQISSPSHNSILSYSLFSSVLNLSHFQLTFFFFLRRPLLLFLSQGVQCNSKYL